MARIRTIKPEFWTHEDLSALPEATHMLAAALLNHADDEGYFNAHPGLIKAACCPLREPSVSVQDSLIALSKAGYLRLFNGTDGKRYGHVVTFDDHQRVNRPTLSKIKGLESFTEVSVSPPVSLTEDSPPEGKGKEGKGTGKPTPTASRTFSGWVQSLDGQKAIPDGHAVFAYAVQVGISDEFLTLAWAWFEKTYGAGGLRAAKRYKDWPLVFQNAVEGNWPKVWYADAEGAFRLSASGLQLKREMEAAP